jgi:hypothetical protein
MLDRLPIGLQRLLEIDVYQRQTLVHQDLAQQLVVCEDVPVALNQPLADGPRLF